MGIEYKSKREIEAMRRTGAIGHRILQLLAAEVRPGVTTGALHEICRVELEKAGFDGVAINEHHGTPFGLGNSPNLMAAALSQVTDRLKILIYENLLPIHEPLRLAEELAMLDCMTNGRLIAGVARGAPREYKIFNVPMSESRGRFNEAFDVIHGAWTQDRFSYNGEFYQFDDVSIWPRPVQQPHPPIWVPLTGSKETIEWAAAHDAAITPGVFRGPMREDTIRYFAQCQEKYGRKVDPNKVSVMVDCYVADSKEQAIEETMKMLGVYADFAENWMAMPVIQGEKTAGERFPGAVSTFCIEAMMQDRKALQAGTSHFLGQNFAKASEIKFQSDKGVLEHAWTTSWPRRADGTALSEGDRGRDPRGEHPPHPRGNEAASDHRDLGCRRRGSGLRPVLEPQAAELVAHVSRGAAGRDRGRRTRDSGARRADAERAPEGCRLPRLPREVRHGVVAQVRA